MRQFCVQQLPFLKKKKRQEKWKKTGKGKKEKGKTSELGEGGIASWCWGDGRPWQTVSFEHKLLFYAFKYGAIGLYSL